MKLSDLKNGQTTYVANITGSRAFCLRLEAMGFVPGQEVTRLYAALPGSPIVFGMLGQKVALRRSEARCITAAPTAAEAEAIAAAAPPLPMAAVTPAPIMAGKCNGVHCTGCTGCGHTTKKVSHSHNRPAMTIALVGNPNCGKTAFFNAACGGHERTGNYAGVTVSSVEGRTNYDGQCLRIVDLPGTYSLSAFSPEEAFVANELTKGEVDVIINVLDVTNLERNLLLTLQLQKTGIPIVGALNMYDELENSNSHIKLDELSKRLGMPLIPTVARSGRGINDALAAAVALKEQTRLAVGNQRQMFQTVTEKNPLSPHTRIHNLIEGVYELRESKAARLSEKIDRIFARTYLSYLWFFVIMGFIFYTTFELGAYPMEWMETGVEALSAFIRFHLAEGWLRDLLVNGIVGGVGCVVVFLPNILILYFFISLLEDSGYLARAALLSDSLLRRVGLPGKSFIPILMGFGCNVPAVMATRTRTPMVPVYCGEKHKFLRRTTIVFGEPYSPVIAGRRATAEESRHAAEEILRRIYALDEVNGWKK